jgi:hypothetical protein
MRFMAYRICVRVMTHPGECAPDGSKVPVN